MRLVLSAVAVASLCASPVWAQSDKSKNTETHDTRPEPPMLGKHLAKGQGARPTRTPPQLTYHGGAIVTGQTVVTPIFWGTTWNSTASQRETDLVIDVLQHDREHRVLEHEHGIHLRHRRRSAPRHHGRYSERRH